MLSASLLAISQSTQNTPGRRPCMNVPRPEAHIVAHVTTAAQMFQGSQGHPQRMIMWEREPLAPHLSIRPRLSSIGLHSRRGNSGCSRWRCRCINIRPCRLLTRVAIGITNGEEALITAHRAANTLAFSKFWYPVRTHAESVVLCPAGIRSLAAVSMSSGLVAYRSGAGARLSCLSWVRVSWTRRAAGAAMRW